MLCPPNSGRFSRIDGKLSGKQTLCKETADEMEPKGGAFAAATTSSRPQRRIAGMFREMVSRDEDRSRRNNLGYSGIAHAF